MVKLKELEDVAIEMADVFTDNLVIVGVASDDQIGPAHSYVSDAGMEKLADIFGRVAIERRAGVYSIFLDKLAERGLSYDINQFKGTVH
jgi:hypothetical protein